MFKNLLFIYLNFIYSHTFSIQVIIHQLMSIIPTRTIDIFLLIILSSITVSTVYHIMHFHKSTEIIIIIITEFKCFFFTS